MKILLLSMLAAFFITIIIPLAAVELARPKTNADSTAPLTPEPTEETAAGPSPAAEAFIRIWA